MKLKIWYTQKTISEVILAESQGRSSAASSSAKKRGIRKHDFLKAQSSVTVETKQESVSCLLWPFEMSQIEKNASNEQEEEFDFSMDFYKEHSGGDQRPSNQQRDKPYMIKINKISEMPSQYEESTNEKM